MRKKKHTATCNRCGAPIRFVRLADGRCIPCEKKAVFIHPQFNNKDAYYTGKGTVINGYEDPNGYLCYKPHFCRVQPV